MSIYNDRGFDYSNSFFITQTTNPFFLESECNSEEASELFPQEDHLTDNRAESPTETSVAHASSPFLEQDEKNSDAGIFLNGAHEIINNTWDFGVESKTDPFAASDLATRNKQTKKPHTLPPETDVFFRREVWDSDDDSYDIVPKDYKFCDSPDTCFVDADANAISVAWENHLMAESFGEQEGEAGCPIVKSESNDSDEHNCQSGDSEKEKGAKSITAEKAVRTGEDKEASDSGPVNPKKRKKNSDRSGKSKKKRISSRRGMSDHGNQDVLPEITTTINLANTPEYTTDFLIKGYFFDEGRHNYNQGDSEMKKTLSQKEAELLEDLEKNRLVVKTLVQNYRQSRPSAKREDESTFLLFDEIDKNVMAIPAFIKVEELVLPSAAQSIPEEFSARSPEYIHLYAHNRWENDSRLVQLYKERIQELTTLINILKADSVVLEGLLNIQDSLPRGARA